MTELKMTPAEVSQKAGLNPGYLRDLLRKNSNPTMGKVAKIAEVLGLSTAFLVSGDSGTNGEQLAPMPVSMSSIVGVIEAGKFRDVSIHSQDDDFPQIPVPQNELFPHLTQYVLEVRGDSMNKIVLEGTYVVCVPFAKTRLSPKPGMIVHVERSMSDGQFVETTLKEIDEVDGELLLRPRSTNLAHQDIKLEGDESTMIEVRGLVVSLWKPLPKRW
jgi:SOS-response transcriptional repressor LexA